MKASWGLVVASALSVGCEPVFSPAPTPPPAEAPAPSTSLVDTSAVAAPRAPAAPSTEAFPRAAPADEGLGETQTETVGEVVSDPVPFTPVLREQVSDADRFAPDAGLGDDVVPLATHGITRGRLGAPVFHAVESPFTALQNDHESRQLLWEFVEPLLGEEGEQFNQFVAFTDGPAGSLAAAFPSRSEPRRWVLAIDVDDAFDESGELARDELRRTVAHELGHLVAQGPEQLRGTSVSSCTTLAIDEGCLRSDAYLRLFHREFWAGHPGTSPCRTHGSEAAERQAAERFGEYPGDFVSEYAATDFVEDFAESFAVHLTGWAADDVAPDELADDALVWRKLAFFDRFPALSRHARRFRSLR